MSVRRMLAACLLTPLLLTGCQEAAGEAEPKLPPTSSATASEKPEVPEKETAEEFIRRWSAEGDRAQVTGDVETYAEMTPKCQPCQHFVQSVEQVYAAGGDAEYAGTQIKEIVRVSRKPPVYEVLEFIPKTTIHHGDTGKTEVLPEGTTKIRVYLERRSGGWRVEDFTLRPVL